MAKAEKKKQNEAERLLQVKRRLIKRLRTDIHSIRCDAEMAVAKVESRIRIAKTLVNALERGTLRP